MDVTNKQLASDMATELKALNIDERMSFRFILSRLKDKTRLFIKQDADSRRLLKITNIWKTIKCLDMCDIDAIECACDIPNCKVIKKSKIKIPRVFDSNYGSLIKVLTIDGGKEYLPTTLSSYIDIKNREIQNPNIKYFWMEDGYIFIPDSMVEQVRVVGLFENPEEVDVINDPSLKCSKPLDALFPCPGHLLEIIKKDTIGELVRLFKNVPDDESPNQNSNLK